MDHNHFAETIVDQGWYKEGDFVLSSGKKSDFYIDLRPCVLDPRFVYLPITALLKHLRHGLDHGDVLCGITCSGLPLVGALVYRLSTCDRDVRSCFCRTVERDHGTKNRVEGPVTKDNKVILVDDVSTSGNSILATANVLRDEGFTVKEALVLVDREEGAVDLLSKNGIPFYPMIRVSQLNDIIKNRKEQRDINANR